MAGRAAARDEGRARHGTGAWPAGRSAQPASPRGRVRPMTAGDVERVFAIQAASYVPAYVESRRSLATRLARHPSGCLVWEGPSPDGGRVVAGYIIFHPYPRGRCAALDPDEEGPPGPPECLYIHDLVIDPAWRGRGIARALALRAIRAAREEGLASLALVAVSGAASFWSRLGFALERRVVYGGLDAEYMVLEL